MNMFSCPKEPNKMMVSSTNNIEDFSFPVVCNNPLSNFMLSSSSASSSSLWRISSKVYHHPEEHNEDKQEYNDNDDDDDYYHMEVRSMCEETLSSSRREIERSVSFQSKDLEVEERMDFLWEDFNEEEKKEVKEKRRSEEMGVLQVRKMSRRTSSGSNSSSKMLVIGKLLKDLVSLRKSAQHKLKKTRFERKKKNV